MSQDMKNPVPFAQSIRFKTLLYLGLSSLIISMIAVTGLFLFQKHLLHRELVKTGTSLMDSLILQSRHSLSKGQRRAFQKVMDNMTLIEPVHETALYNSLGLMTFLSGEPSVGRSFVKNHETGAVINLNKKLYEETGGSYLRHDWNLRDLHQTKTATDHIAKRRGVGLQCTNCHFMVDSGLSYNDRNEAFLIQDALSHFYYRIRAASECIICHTNWKKDDVAGYVRVTLDNAFVRQQQKANLLGIHIVLALILVPALIIFLAVSHVVMLRPINYLIHSFDFLSRAMERPPEKDTPKTLSRMPNLDYERSDEFGVLNRAFRHMWEARSRYLTSINDKRKRLEEFSKHIEQKNRELKITQKKLRDMAIHDPLTGLYNRRHMEEFMKREIIKAKRANGSVGIIMLDIDFFKKFNDTYGHAAGDLVLKEVAGVLLKHCRSDDIVCRYGGEEFIVVMPGLSPAQMKSRAEDLRCHVMEKETLFDEKTLPHITISLGMALFPLHAGGIDSVIKKADQALYQAKEEGRNRSVLCPL